MFRKENLKEKYQKELSYWYKRWNHLNAYGGSDPNWTDGCNMNLARNHIIYYKQQCINELAKEEYPEEFYYALPEEVSQNYMARADEIRKHAAESLAIYMKHPDFLYLQEVKGSLTKEQVKDSLILNVLNYCYGLELFIKQDDLVHMRVHEHPERFLASFRSCRKRIEVMVGVKRTEKPLPEGQLSIFDIYVFY